MFFPQPTLHLDASDADLVSRMAREERCIAAALAPYDPNTATYAWFDTLRAIEEVINLPTVDWNGDHLKHELYDLPIRDLSSDPRPLAWAKQLLGRRFSDTFTNRFIQLMVQSAAVSDALRIHGLDDLAARFDTLGMRSAISNRDAVILWPCFISFPKPVEVPTRSIRSRPWSTSCHWWKCTAFS